MPETDNSYVAFLNALADQRNEAMKREGERLRHLAEWRAAVAVLDRLTGKRVSTFG